MPQYRKDAKKATPDNDNDNESLLTENAAPPKVEAFMDLAAKYGLDTDMVISTVTPGKKYQPSPFTRTTIISSHVRRISFTLPLCGARRVGRL